MSTFPLRPVGLHELGANLGPRNARVPPTIATPADFLSRGKRRYARQIARDWNVGDEKSGFAGFVTAFELNRVIYQISSHTL